MCLTYNEDILEFFPKFLRIGTRASPLAMIQAEIVLSQLEDLYPFLKGCIELCPMKTSGDILVDKPLREFGGKGLFTKELETALLTGKIDLAVHSLKDMPTVLPEGLMLSCFLKRTEARDAFVSFEYNCIQDLPKNALLGTSSLRRQAQILSVRPDLTIVPLRGNMNTRLSKIREGQMDGAILSLAGLNRLDFHDPVKEILDPLSYIPAPGQGVICIEICNTNSLLHSLLKPLNDLETEYCIQAERAVLKAVDGSCRVPVGAWARKEDNNVFIIHGFLATDPLTHKNIKCVQNSLTGIFEDSEEIGQKLGTLLKEQLILDLRQDKYTD